MKRIQGRNLIGNDPQLHAYLKGLDPFEKADFFKMYLEDKEVPGSGWAMYSEQVRVGRQLGLLTYEDDFFAQRAMPGGKSLIPFETVTRNNKHGIPVYDPENTRNLNVQLPVPSLSESSVPVMRNAYAKNIALLEKEATDLGLDLSEIQKSSQDAWMLVSPAFKLLEGYEMGSVDSGESINASHKNFVAKYALSKAIGFNATPDSQGLIDDLYLGTNWLVNIPGMPGLKRLIPKNIPFQFASDLTSTDIEYFINAWHKHGIEYKDYIKSKIKEDDGNVNVYVDVSGTGAGLSYFFGSKNSAVGAEDPSTLITWTEFGDWMERKYKFAMLSEVENWFRKKDPGDPRRVMDIYNKSRYEKLVDIIRDFEDALENSPDQVTLNRSWVDNMFYDSANSFMSLNRSPVNLSDMRQFGDFSGEWNWFLSALDQRTEIGAIEYEVLKDLLTKVSSKTPPEKFDAILESEMQKYFLQEKDWWDTLKSKNAMFGQYASSVINAMNRSGDKNKVPEKYRQNPN